jgi:RimJ/RimL family protein N-acetyltransferase
MEDSQRIWTWRNDSDTRAASFDTAEIPWEVHDRWFAESLRRTDRKIFVVVVRNLPEGSARLDIAGPEAAVSIHLAPECRGKGIGAIALEQLAVIARRDFALRRLVASVKPDNVASLSAFRKAGFVVAKSEAGVVTLGKRLG